MYIDIKILIKQTQFSMCTSGHLSRHFLLKLLMLMMIFVVELEIQKKVVSVTIEETRLRNTKNKQPETRRI